MSNFGMLSKLVRLMESNCWFWIVIVFGFWIFVVVVSEFIRCELYDCIEFL